MNTKSQILNVTIKTHFTVQSKFCPPLIKVNRVTFQIQNFHIFPRIKKNCINFVSLGDKIKPESAIILVCAAQTCYIKEKHRHHVLPFFLITRHNYFIPSVLMSFPVEKGNTGYLYKSMKHYTPLSLL